MKTRYEMMAMEAALIGNGIFTLLHDAVMRRVDLREGKETMELQT